MWKSLHRKKLESHFQSVPGFEPKDLQNYTFLQTCAVAHVATATLVKLRSISEIYSKMFLRPLIKEAGARKRKDLDTVSWLGIVVLDAVHVFQGAEWCRNGIWWCEDLGKNNLFSKLEILKPEKKFLPPAKIFLVGYFFLIC